MVTEFKYYIIYTGVNCMNKKDFIFKLGTIRREKNLSARQLSLKIGMNEGYINRLECGGEFYPSMETFFDILEACGYTAEKFFYHDPSLFDSDMELLKNFKCLSEEKKQALLTLLKNRNEWKFSLVFV